MRSLPLGKAREGPLMMVVAPPCLPIIVRDVIISVILTIITRVMLVESRFFGSTDIVRG